MKKILLLICLIFSAIAFIPNSYALSYYDSVIIKTSFAEEINLDEIEKIEIAYADQTNYTKYITLYRENNFEGVLENIPVGTINIEYGIVNDDTIGYYNVSADVYDNLDNTIDIVVNVSLQNNQKNEEIFNEEKKNLMDSTNVKNENKDVNNSSDNEEIDISDSTTTKTTTTVKNDLEEEIRKREEKHAINRKKNGYIGIIMFSLIGLAISVAIIYATLKISKANK